MNKKRAQAAMEYIMVVGISLILVGGAATMLLVKKGQSDEDIADKRIESIGTEILEYASAAYYSSGLYKKTVLVKIPTQVKRVYTENSRFLVFEKNNEEVIVLEATHPLFILIQDDEIHSGKLVIEKRLDKTILCATDNCSCSKNESNACGDKIDNDCDGLNDDMDYPDCTTEQPTCEQLGRDCGDWNFDFGTINCGGCWTCLECNHQGKCVDPGGCYKYAWENGSWTECHTTCGKSVQSRSVLCKRNDGAIVTESYCTEEKPVTFIPCENYTGCTYNWIMDDWSECSKICGNGTHVRNVACQRSDGVNVSDASCSGDGQKPDDDGTCNTFECTYTYTEWSNWEDCSSTCGGGITNRSRTCFWEDANIYVDCTLCGNNCSEGAACANYTGCEYSWNIGDWDACSEETRERNVFCEREDHVAVDDLKCPPPTPIRSEDCITCTSSESTRTCDTYQTGYVCTNPDIAKKENITTDADCSTYCETFNKECCQHKRDNGDCIPGDAPVYYNTDDAAWLSGNGAAAACQENIEVFEWVTGDWSSCSATCGDGTETRSVLCKSTETSITVADSKCSSCTKPEDAKPCTINCPIDGVCGAAHEYAGQFMPDGDYCESGITTEIIGADSPTGPWSWSCVGEYDGDTSGCYATYVPPPRCGYNTSAENETWWKYTILDSEDDACYEHGYPEFEREIYINGTHLDTKTSTTPMPDSTYSTGETLYQRSDFKQSMLIDDGCRVVYLQELCWDQE